MSDSKVNQFCRLVFRSFLSICHPAVFRADLITETNSILLTVRRFEMVVNVVDLKIPFNYNV